MDKNDVIWLQNIENQLMEDKGWKLISFTDHYNNHIWYEIKDPDGFFLDFSTTDIYKAIDRINQEIEGKDDSGFNKFIKMLS